MTKLLLQRPLGSRSRGSAVRPSLSRTKLAALVGSVAILYNLFAPRFGLPVFGEEEQLALLTVVGYFVVLFARDAVGGGKE